MVIYHPRLQDEYEALCKAGKEEQHQPSKFTSDRNEYTFIMQRGITKRLFCDFGAELQYIMELADSYMCDTEHEEYTFATLEDANAGFQEMLAVLEEWEQLAKMWVTQEDKKVIVTYLD